MRGIFFKVVAGSAVVFTMINCTRVDNAISTTPSPPTTTAGVLPKKIVQTGGTYPTTLTFTYDGSKITQVDSSAKTDGVATVKYYYTGDDITKYEYIRPGYGTDTAVLEYTSGKLSKTKWINTSGVVSSEATYAYNADGTTTVSNVIPSNTKFNSTTVLTYSGENVIKTVMTQGTNTYTNEFKYDTNNLNVFKNVKGFSKIRDLGYVDEFFKLPGNVFATEKKATSNTGNVYDNYTITFTGTFNTDKLPTKVTTDKGTTFEISY